MHLFAQRSNTRLRESRGGNSLLAAARDARVRPLANPVGNRLTRPLTSADEARLEGSSTARALTPPSSNGGPLDPAARNRWGERLGHNFANVRIFSNPASFDAAASREARAFTIGRQIHFGTTYDPTTSAGESLLAHELTHVVQSDRATAHPTRSGTAVEGLEQEARRVANAVETGAPVRPIRGVARGLTAPLRQPADSDSPTFGNLPREKPDPVGTRRVELMKRGERWYEVGGPSRSRRRAAGSYDFVVQGDRIWAVKSRSRFGHTEAAQGGRVRFAGQIRFGSSRGGRGLIREWNNASGHYRPSKVFARNAGLPMERFKAYAGVSKAGSQLPVIQPRPGDVIDPPRGSVKTGGSTKGVPSGTTVSGEIDTPRPRPRAATGRPPPKPDLPKVPSAPTTRPSTASRASKASRFSRTLGSVASWGKISPFDGAMLYLDLHAAHFAALSKVSQQAAIARSLLRRAASLESGARALRKAVNAQRRAESELPSYPLLLDEEAGQMIVSAAEMAYVRDYYRAAARIANDAMAARAELYRAIEGWKGVLAHARKANDFTRQAIWQTVIQIDLRFSNQGGSFKAYLQSAHDDAERVHWWARTKQWHASHILGVGWVPETYEPPTPQSR